MALLNDTITPRLGNHHLENIVLMKNPELTKQILEQSNFRCSSEINVVKRALEAADFDNLRILLHHGRGWKTRRAIFERELFRLIDCDLTSAKSIVQQLPNLDVINEHFIISLRHLFEQGTHEVLKMLLEYNIDLHVSDKYGIKLLVNVFGNPKVNVDELFENRVIDVHEQDVSGGTALHAAVDNDIVKNVRFLLDHGADPNAKDCVGWTPMFVIKSVECMELLLEYGGDLQNIDKDGYTIFDSFQTFSNTMTQAALANLAIAEASGKTVRQVIRDKINSTEKFKVFYENCHREIKCMKEVFGSNDLFAILRDSTEKVFNYISNPEIISTFLNQTRIMNGYIYSMLEKKLRRIEDTRSIYHKPAKVAVKNNDILDPYHSIAAKIVNYSTIEDLLVFFWIVFNSIRIFF